MKSAIRSLNIKNSLQAPLPVRTSVERSLKEGSIFDAHQTPQKTKEKDHDALTSFLGTKLTPTRAQVN